MDSFARATVYLPTTSKDVSLISINKRIANNGLGDIAFANDTAAIDINTYDMTGVSAVAAMDSGLLTEPYPPAFITCGHGSKTSKSSSKLWTCCNCSHSGMAVKSSNSCPNCGHYECNYCEEYKPKSKH